MMTRRFDHDDEHRVGFLGWCNGFCTDTLRNSLAMMVSITVLIGATYSLSKWIGWPDLVNMTEHRTDLKSIEDRLGGSIAGLKRDMRLYFGNLQRMAWVTRMEVLQSRRVSIAAQRQEYEDAIALHTKEVSRPDSSDADKAAASRRIRTLKEQIELLDREEAAALSEQRKYMDLLQQSDGGLDGPVPTGNPPQQYTQPK